MAQDPSIGREILPIPDRVKPGLTVLDAKDPADSFPPIEPLRPPKGAPNVLLVLLDEVGFAVPPIGPVTTMAVTTPDPELPTTKRRVDDGSQAHF